MCTGGLVHLWVQAKHFNWKEIHQRLEEHTAEFLVSSVCKYVFHPIQSFYISFWF